MDRSDPGLVVGIDLGSQSAKVVVHDLAGAVVASAQRPLAASVSPAPGQVEHPGDSLWDALAAACSEAMAALGPRVGEVRAVGLCGIRFCIALLRADGSLAAPVRSWMDTRRADDPPGDTAHVVASSAYLTARLTGVVRDSSAAYALWQPRADDLVEPGEVLGAVTADAAAATGLPAGVPVVATANDKAVEALGCGLLEPGPLLVSLGTFVASMAVGPRSPAEGVAETGASYWTNPAAVPGEVLLESTGVRRGMWTVSWVRDLVGHHVAGDGRAGDEVALGEAAAALPVGADGLLCVPDWLAPPDAPWRRGAFVGFDGRHGPAHLYRAVLEGLVLTVTGHARSMADEVGLAVPSVVVSGGGGRSPLVLAMVAACLDRPVRAPVAPSAAGLGAALAAAVGVGLHPSWTAAVDAMVHLDDPVAPDPTWVAAYADVRVRHAALVDGLDTVLRELR
ncbi:FGGY-family carbohydrate kinase [uncultured Nocardioides sp.]|uniref:FGGY-family carbohydrate kinase n=1 Tax=uncultured Nocardioides sp. TaxID=198441 RepID=UPI0026130675|nr:FGGY-family carbohydrate kinase [uncultured Nocardioides sp.]